MAQRLFDITALEPLIRDGFIPLTPNHRLARRIKAQWDGHRAEGGECAWQSLPVWTLEDWLRSRWELAVSHQLLPPAVPLGTAQALALWRQVIGDAQQRQSGQFHLLLPTASAEIAHRARESLRRWQVDTSDARIRQLFSLDLDCDSFWQWLESFDLRLQKSGLSTTVDCLAQLPSVAARLPRERVVLVEFDEVPPLLRAALDAACDRVETVAPVAAAAGRLIHPFSEKRAELRAVASWAANLHRADPNTTIGIVPGDAHGDRVALEYLLRREFNCLGKDYTSLPVNFSMGTPLARTPLVRDALATLAMGLSHTTLPTLVGLLHSRFLDLQDEQVALSQGLLNRLHAAGKETLAIADLSIAIREISVAVKSESRLLRHLQVTGSMRELRRTGKPSAWATRFGDVLAVWGWPRQPTLDSVEYQQLALWYRTLDEFRTFDAVCGKIPYGEALSLLEDCCSREVSHPQTADFPIQVLGPLEAAGLSFDHLWLCSMQATSWPAAPQPNPFIPLSLQSRLRMPHANPEREQAFCTILLKQYTRACRTLHASYARQVDGVPDAPSALLADFVIQELPEPPMPNVAWAAGAGSATLEEVADCGAPLYGPPDPATMTGGSRLLEDQSHCPFRAFARHRLLIPPRVGSHAALTPGGRGSLLHAALHALWSELGSLAKLQKMSTDMQEEVMERAIDTALAHVSASMRRSIGAAYWRLERKRLAALLREWLSVERQRSEFSVVAQEQALAVELAGMVLQLRVDRIDQLADGSQVIIDYKSGDCSVLDWLGARPSRPQLPLYAIAEPHAAAALAFARVRPRDCGYIGLGRLPAAPGIRTDIPHTVNNGTVIGNWHTLNERWREDLEQLAREFAAGVARVDPLSSTSCDHCGLQPLCRIASPADSAGEEAA